MPIDIMKGVSMEDACSMAKNLEFKEELIDTAATQILKLYDLFCGVDATQVEINPFGETPDGRGTVVQCSLFIKDTIGPTLPVLNACTV